MSKTIVITGANAGIGLATAHRLAAGGHTVVMACRNQDKAKAAREEILRATPDAKLDLLSLDLSSFEHIRRFADELATTHPRVDVLINNAGASPVRQEFTQDGFEMQWGANYLGPVLLTHLILPQLQAAAAETGDARVIHLGSVAHNLGRMNEKTWRGRRFYWALPPYAQSKMGNVMFNYALSRRLPDGLTTHALHPGGVASDIYRDIPQPFRWAILKAMIPAERPATLIEDMATAPEHKERSGQYLTAQKPNPVRKYAKNQAAQDDLYSKSCELVSVEPLPVSG